MTLISVFGEMMSKEIISENENDAAIRVNANKLYEHWDKICKVIENLPSPEHLIEVYSSLNIKKTLEEIGVPSELKKEILECSPSVRNRLTLMRIKKCITESKEL